MRSEAVSQITLARPNAAYIHVSKGSGTITFETEGLMEVNQTSVAFAGTAAVSPQQQQETQKSAKDERDDVQRSTANVAAVSPADAAEIRPDVPEDADETEPLRATAESDPPTDSGEERDRSRGDRVDVTV